MLPIGAPSHMPFQRSDSWFHLGWLRVVNHDSQRANFQVLPPAKGKLVRWLVGGEVLASRSLFRSGMGSVGLARRRQDAKKDKTPIVAPHTMFHSLRHFTCRFDWQREVTAHRKSRQEIQAARRKWNWGIDGFLPSRFA